MQRIIEERINPAAIVIPYATWSHHASGTLKPTTRQVRAASGRRHQGVKVSLSVQNGHFPAMAGKVREANFKLAARDTLCDLTGEARQ